MLVYMTKSGVIEYSARNRTKILDFLDEYNQSRSLQDIKKMDIWHNVSQYNAKHILRQHINEVKGAGWCVVCTSSWHGQDRLPTYLLRDTSYLMIPLKDDPESSVQWKDVFIEDMYSHRWSKAYDASTAVLLEDYITLHEVELRNRILRRFIHRSKYAERQTLQRFNSTKKLGANTYSVNMDEPLMVEVVKLLKYTTVIPQKDV